jgi:hypothetical protein
MPKPVLFLMAGAIAASAASPQSIREPAGEALVYVGDKLRKPVDYREWIFLSAGLDMSYSSVQMPGHHMFGNVFVNPQAYREFQRTGTWPDKTAIVLEMRGAQGKGSINRAGLFQDGDVMGVEVHVKDESRFSGKWAFFAFQDDRPAGLIPTDVDCYACHARHAAVDTTFVQFYPTLLPVAVGKGTLSASYLAENPRP